MSTIKLCRYVFWRDEAPPASCFAYTGAERDTDEATIAIVRKQYDEALVELRTQARLDARRRRSRRERRAAGKARAILSFTQSVAYSTKRQALWKLWTQVRLGDWQDGKLYDTVQVKGGR